MARKRKAKRRSGDLLRVAGLTIANRLCPKCGSKMFIKPCPCWLRRSKFKTCARCIRCGTQVGLKR